MLWLLLAVVLALSALWLALPRIAARWYRDETEGEPGIRRKDE